MRKPIHRVAVGSFAAAAIVTSGVAVLNPFASAASRDGSCSSGEFCYYMHSSSRGYGSVSDFTTSVSNYGTKQPSCYVFKGTGSGKGQCIKNNAAAVWNRTSKTVRVYFHTGYQGKYQDIKPGYRGNLNATLANENASHQILTPGGHTGSGGHAQAPRNDYDGNPRGFAQWNCTAFAAYRIATRDGRPHFGEGWKGQHFGNAGTWDDAARRAGVTVNKKPSVGAIAVNDVHKVGHVAYVNKVYADGSFDVEEYNWNVHHGYGTRHHVRVNNAQASFQWMLHF